MIGYLAVGGMALAVVGMKRAADRFATRKVRAGEWDENGPKQPIDADPRYRTVGEFRIDNPFANLVADVDVEQEVEELRERDLPGIAELVQRVLDLLLDGSQPCHEALRGQLESIRIGDIDLADRTMEIRVVVAASAPRCSPPELQGGVVEIRVDGIAQPPYAGAVVQDGCLSTVIINTFGSRWPKDAEVRDLRLMEPLVPTES